MATYLRDPTVTVTINNFIGPFSEQIRVIGEAAQPQAINYLQNMTLLDVMIQVGGLTEFADGNDAILVRIENGKQIEYDIYIDDLIKNGQISANVDVLPVISSLFRKHGFKTYFLTKKIKFNKYLLE